MSSFIFFEILDTGNLEMSWNYGWSFINSFLTAFSNLCCFYFCKLSSTMESNLWEVDLALTSALLFNIMTLILISNSNLRIKILNTFKNCCSPELNVTVNE